jgi:hypothetical protein
VARRGLLAINAGSIVHANTSQVLQFVYLKIIDRVGNALSSPDKDVVETVEGFVMTSSNRLISFYVLPWLVSNLPL